MAPSKQYKQQGKAKDLVLNPIEPDPTTVLVLMFSFICVHVWVCRYVGGVHRILLVDTRGCLRLHICTCLVVLLFMCFGLLVIFYYKSYILANNEWTHVGN